MTEVKIVRKGDRPTLKQQFETPTVARDAILRYMRLGYVEYRETSEPTLRYIPLADVAEFVL